MDTQQLKAQALRHGLQLRPLAASIRETLEDLSEGRALASVIAQYRLIMPTAASNRLVSLVTLGLAEPLEMSGREKPYRLTYDGRAASEARAEEP